MAAALQQIVPFGVQVRNCCNMVPVVCAARHSTKLVAVVLGDPPTNWPWFTMSTRPLYSTLYTLDMAIIGWVTPPGPTKFVYFIWLDALPGSVKVLVRLS